MTDLTDAICCTLLLFACGWLIWTDLRHGIIPDWINGLIAALGLARTFAMEGALGPLIAGSQGLIIAALLLLLRELYFRWRSIQGLGLGDVKFLAAATLWTGLFDFPILLLAASVAALFVVLCLHMVGQGVTARTSIPFGPFLVVGLLVVLAVQTSAVSMPFQTINLLDSLLPPARIRPDVHGATTTRRAASPMHPLWRKRGHIMTKIEVNGDCGIPSDMKVF